jgi:DnaD/phage-associated family protein
MTDLDRTAPVESSPGISVPRALLKRMVTSNASAGEYRIELLLALMTQHSRPTHSAIAEDVFAHDPQVIDAGKTDGTPIGTPEWPWNALEQAIAHGIVLRFSATVGSVERTWLMLNTVENASQVAAMADDPARVPAEFWIGETRPRISVDRPTVFRIYEQNIGPLTPLIADQLIKALETYPVGWIESAMEEAVAYNRRSWRYVSRILENWTVDGPSGRTGNR